MSGPWACPLLPETLFNTYFPRGPLTSFLPATSAHLIDSRLALQASFCYLCFSMYFPWNGVHPLEQSSFCQYFCLCVFHHLPALCCLLWELRMNQIAVIVASVTQASLEEVSLQGLKSCQIQAIWKNSVFPKKVKWTSLDSHVRAMLIQNPWRVMGLILIWLLNSQCFLCWV